MSCAAMKLTAKPLRAHVVGDKGRRFVRGGPCASLLTMNGAAAGQKGGVVSNKGTLDIVTVSSEADGTLEATLTLPLGSPKLLMPEIAQRVAADTMLRATPGERPKASLM